VATLGQLDSEFDRLRQDIAIAFAPEVIDALKAFGNWIKDHHGDIIGFFKEAGDSIKISQIQLAARQHVFVFRWIDKPIGYGCACSCSSQPAQSNVLR
jgi:hypothetical protein